MNHNYARLMGGKLQYAPSTLITPQGSIMNPKRLSYLQAGWKLLDLQTPAEAPEGKECVISGYTETQSDIRPVYKLVATVLAVAQTRFHLSAEETAAILNESIQ